MKIIKFVLLYSVVGVMAFNLSININSKNSTLDLRAKKAIAQVSTEGKSYITFTQNGITYYFDEDYYSGQSTFSLSDAYDAAGNFISYDATGFSDYWGDDYGTPGDYYPYDYKCLTREERTVGLNVSSTGGGVTYSEKKEITQYVQKCGDGSSESCFSASC